MGDRRQNGSRKASISTEEMNRRMEAYLNDKDLKPKVIEEIVENGMVIKRYEADPYLGKR